MKKWYQYSTGPNIDRVLATYDDKKNITHICVLLHSINHFVLLDVVLPNEDNKHGNASIYNYHRNIRAQSIDVTRM